MQNTKIQTLWNLCNELKEKRQFLVERLKHTQDYLDEQQWNLSREMHGLRQQTNSLAEDVGTLSYAVESIYSLWSNQSSQPNTGGESVDLPDFQPLLEAAQTQQELAQGFADQAANLALLAGEIHLPDSPELFQEGFQELQSEFTQHYGAFKAAQQYFASLQSQALSASSSEQPDFSELNASLSASAEFLASFGADAEGFQTQWQASKPYREAAPAAPSDGSAQAELTALQAQLEAREKLLSETYTQAYASAVALAELQGQHDDLAGEMEHLMGVLANFQDILNQRPQTEAGAVAVAIAASSSDDEDEESEESTDSPESDRQVIREAVQESARKRIAQVLKKRFTKVPRRVSNLLKKIEVSSRLDKLFELALECDSMDAFSSQLEESAS
ncbi:MAG: hypothetical protein AB7I41_21620 [Candidatus Sericytochromatia bacterium]